MDFSIISNHFLECTFQLFKFLQNSCNFHRHHGFPGIGIPSRLHDVGINRHYNLGSLSNFIFQVPVGNCLFLTGHGQYKKNRAAFLPRNFLPRARKTTKTSRKTRVRRMRNKRLCRLSFSVPGMGALSGSPPN